MTALLDNFLTTHTKSSFIKERNFVMDIVQTFEGTLGVTVVIEWRKTVGWMNLRFFYDAFLVKLKITEDFPFLLVPMDLLKSKI